GELGVDGGGGSAHQGAQRRAEPTAGELRRMEAAGELSYLLEDRLDLPRHPLEPLVGAPQFGRDRRLQGLKVEAERDQPLLGAVVQVALDPPPRLVAGRDDARA